MLDARLFALTDPPMLTICAVKDAYAELASSRKSVCGCAVELCKYKPPSGGSEVLVAVKRLLPSILKNKEELLAFVEETKLLRKLRHRHRPACFAPAAP